MKLIIKKSVFTLLAFTMIILAGCSPKTDTADTNQTKDRIIVCTTFYTMNDFAGKIGGDRINLFNLVPTGVEPHDWEPSPKDIAKIEKAHVFIYNGAGMEGWVDRVLKSVKNTSLIKVGTAENLDLPENDHNPFESDPHVWLNPMLAKKQMEAIKDALSKADPLNAEFYQENFLKYSKELDKLDSEYKSVISGFTRKDIVVSHQAFGYLCSAYGLNQVAIEGLNTDTEPTPSRMAEVSRYVKDNNIKVIFFEELINDKIAKTIANSAGVDTDVLNPLEGLKSEDIARGKEYFSVMRDNLEALKRALE